MEESEGYGLGELEPCEAAVTASKEIIDRLLASSFRPGMPADELYEESITLQPAPGGPVPGMLNALRATDLSFRLESAHSITEVHRRDRSSGFYEIEAYVGADPEAWVGAGLTLLVTPLTEAIWQHPFQIPQERFEQGLGVELKHGLKFPVLSYPI